MSEITVKIKCVQHGQLIGTRMSKAPNGSLQVFHERHGSRCESERFTKVKEIVLNRETAVAELIRLKLEAEHRP